MSLDNREGMLALITSHVKRHVASNPHAIRRPIQTFKHFFGICASFHFLGLFC